MEETQKKNNQVLSIDRAAFLLLRVKRAFKKKRQQRKEKSIQNVITQPVFAGFASPNQPQFNRSLTLPAMFDRGSNNDTKSYIQLTGDIIGDRVCITRTALLNRVTKSNQGCTDKLIGTSSRRLSWDRRDPFNYYLNRSSSIDSIVETGWSDSSSDISLSEKSNMSLSSCSMKRKHVNQLNYNLNVKIKDSPLSPSSHRKSKQIKFIYDVNITELIKQNHVLQKKLENSTDIKHALNKLKKNIKSNVLPLELNLQKKLSLKNIDFMAPQKMIHNIKSDDENGEIEMNSLPAEPKSSLSKVKSLNIHPHKMTKKELKVAQAQLEKLRQANSHLHALFSAVDHGHLDKARTILESTDVNVNSLNNEGLTSLDVAVLSNNRSMTKMLLQHGALGAKHFTTESIGNHLNRLLCDAENHVQDISCANGDICQLPFSSRASFSNIITGNSSSITGCTGTETTSQLSIWERRIKGLRRLLLGWDQARPPDLPRIVAVNVCNDSLVTVHLIESTKGPIASKFKVQWSTKSDFSNILGERVIEEWCMFQCTMGSNCTLRDLTRGRRYFFRACCGNVKGWGSFRKSSPASVIPSSWRDVENRKPRFSGKQHNLENLFAEVRVSRPCNTFELSLDAMDQQGRNQRKKTTIKQLFSATSKFQKHLRRGIYLACVLYHEDKVLMTNEDFLPVIEIDETYPRSFNNDFHWLMKVSCTWEDVKPLRMEMEKNASSAVHFRLKLLSAACNMQNALCSTDLGQFFHKPLRDFHGTIVLTCVNAVKNPKMVSILNSRWVPRNKIMKKVNLHTEDNNINEILISFIPEQISFHQNSTSRLSPGLYLGYLKMQSSVDQIQVVVPSKTPNVLPHWKIRENTHVSGEEWQSLVKNKKLDLYALQLSAKSDSYTEAQILFMEMLAVATRNLFTYMNIPLQDAFKHRLFDVEVIEFSQDVSFLVMCPPVDQTCAAPGQHEILRDDLIALPIQVFEMVHLKSYQHNIIQKYSRLSCILEWDTAIANHSHREAFSSNELKIAKERLKKVNDFTTNLNSIWKEIRWLMDVIGFARDKNRIPSLSVKEITTFSSYATNPLDYGINSENCQLLQLPIRDTKSKVNPGRGSWPGPPAESSMNTECYLGAEHSKSEQHLEESKISTSSRSQYSTPYANTACKDKLTDSAQCNESCKYVTAGNYEDLFGKRLPPSKSENTLVLIKKNSSTQNTKNITRHFNNTDITNQFEIKSTKICESFKDQSTNFVELRSKLRSINDQSHISEPASPKSEKHQHIITKYKSEEDVARCDNKSSGAVLIPQSSTIQVYAAYDTGLTIGTSLKLHVSQQTTAREVIDLVVKQLNMANIVKGTKGPIYNVDTLHNFCLVAVIGARERCLRDDFRPLQLQSPWRQGKLYVRHKHELLAAIEHSNQEAQFI